MDINYHNLGILRTGIDTRFKRTFDASAKDQYSEFTTTIPMSTEVITMPFLEQLTGMREWIDDRVINNLRADRLSVTPRKFELTYGIPREAIEDDTYGIAAPRSATPMPTSTSPWWTRWPSRPQTCAPTSSRPC